MKPRLFLDTNVLLDFFLARKPYGQSAALLLDAGIRHRCDLYISAITFCNVAYILGRIEKTRIIEKDMELLLNCVKIAPNDASQLGKALYFQSPDYEDSIQYASAVETKCSYLVTSNIKHFRNARINVLNPDEAVKVIRPG